MSGRQGRGGWTRFAWAERVVWRRRTPTAGEDDPAVAAVEALLEAAATRHPAGDWHGRIQHLLWICACVTYFDHCAMKPIATAADQAMVAG